MSVKKGLGWQIQSKKANELESESFLFIAFISSGHSSAFRLVKVSWSFQLSWFILSILFSSFCYILLRKISSSKLKVCFVLTIHTAHPDRFSQKKVRRQQKKYCWLWNEWFKDFSDHRKTLGQWDQEWKTFWMLLLWTFNSSLGATLTVWQHVKIPSGISNHPSCGVSKCNQWSVRGRQVLLSAAGHLQKEFSSFCTPTVDFPLHVSTKRIAPLPCVATRLQQVFAQLWFRATNIILLIST